MFKSRNKRGENFEKNKMSDSILGNGNASVDSDVRHVISFRGWSGKVNISDTLKNFYQFVYNPDKRRVSFVTEKNTNWRKPFSTDIFSTDSSIDTYNKEFLKINTQIPYQNNAITTYDMIADPEDTKIWKLFNKQVGELGTNLPFYFASGLFGLWLWKKK